MKDREITIVLLLRSRNSIEPEQGARKIVPSRARAEKFGAQSEGILMYNEHANERLAVLVMQLA